MSQAHYLRQGISLVGYGTTTFENAITSTQEIYGLFDHNVQDMSLEPWALMATCTAQGSMLEASNQYLTATCNAPNMQPIPISPLVDPHGILEKFTKDGFGFLHSEENEVHYYQIHKMDTGKR